MADDAPDTAAATTAPPTTAPPTPAPPIAARSNGPLLRRRAYWVALAAAALAFLGGIALAATGYTSTSTATGTVRAYFAAIARADAPDALSYGDVPAGSHRLLTSTVLVEQLQVAPILDVQVAAVAGASAQAGADVPVVLGSASGSTSRAPAVRAGGALVHVSYELAYPSGDRRVSADIPLHRSAGEWRLDQAAAPVRLVLSGARQRATVAGGALPTGRVLMFPGALPLHFDTRYLQVDAGQRAVTPAPTSSTVTTTVRVGTSGAGRRAMIAAVVTALRGCLAGRAPDAGATCPLPDERYLPGSLRGTVTGSPQQVRVTTTSQPVGVLQFFADVPVAITYRRLDFRNHVTVGSSRQLIFVHASAAAVPPLHVQWQLP